MRKSEKLEKVIIKSDHPLFAHIPPRENYLFSTMKGSDLRDLIFYLNKYPLELRNRLGLDQSITFGFEIETEWVASQWDIEYFLADFPGWEKEHDGSLSRGSEIVSPILTDTGKAWDDLKKVCLFLNKVSEIDKRAGGHIHIGSQIFKGNPKAVFNFMKCWSVYENILFRFSYGEFLNARPDIEQYAEPIGKEFLEFYDKYSKHPWSDDPAWVEDRLRQFNDRYVAVNLENLSDIGKKDGYNTIEFRCPNGSLQPVIWQNNLNLFARLLLYSNSPRYNDEIIDQRRRMTWEQYSSLDFYHELYLQQALEFCDLIFTKNVDKLYFLRQYLKSFQTSSEYEAAESFVKQIKH